MSRARPTAKRATQHRAPVLCSPHAMALAHAPLRARAAPFAGSRVALRSKAAPRAVAARPSPSGPRAGLFDFLQPKEEPAAAAKLAYICLDCGYISTCAAIAARRGAAAAKRRAQGFEALRADAPRACAAAATSARRAFFTSARCATWARTGSRSSKPRAQPTRSSRLRSALSRRVASTLTERT